ncbi:hypothetical protein FI667_g9675, partial [Globisporangium splendens]
MARTAASVAEAHAAAASSSASAAYATALPRRTPGLGDMMNAARASESNASDSEADQRERANDAAAEVHGHAATRENGLPVNTIAAANADPNDPMGDKYTIESFPDRFPSWEALDAYMEEFKEYSYQMFGVRTSVPVRLRNQRIANRARPNADESFNEPLPESWRFYNRIYTCTHGTRFQGGRGKKGLRAHGAVRDTGCTARIGATLKVDVPTRLYYISVRVDGFHNHPCDKERYYGYAENRSIKDPTLAQKLLELRDRGVTVAEIHRRIAKLIAESGGEGGVPTRADLHNTISRVRAARQAETGTTFEPQTHTRDAEDEASDESAEEEDRDDDNDEAVEPEDAERRESSSKKRKADELASLDDDLKGFARMRKPDVPVKLFQLEALLDTSYSYRLIRKLIESVTIARAQSLPRSISGFVHEIVPLTASEASEDVDFLLPQYVIYGCENGIVTYCRYHGVHPTLVGVKLPVVRQFSSEAPTLAIISSHQLRVMKQIHLARQNIRDANYMIEWLQNTVKLQVNGVALAPPFGDYVHWSKDRFLTALKLTPLTKVVVRGVLFVGGHEFTDTIVGVRILRFCSNTNLDVDCMKAILLRLHGRFHSNTSFVCPSFLLEIEERERSRKACTYGAFTAQKATVVGVAQVQSGHWGAFVLNWPKRQCFVCAPDETAFNELKQSLANLFRPFAKNVVFCYAPCPEDATTSTDAGDSGILALLFLECVLVRKTWSDIPFSASMLHYYRLRYLMYAIQVMHKQDVHEIP